MIDGRAYRKIYEYLFIKKDTSPNCDRNSGVVFCLTFVVTVRVNGDNRVGKLWKVFVGNMGFVVWEFDPKYTNTILLILYKYKQIIV